MGAKDLFESAREASREAERIRQQLIHIEERATCVSRPSLEAHVRGGGMASKVEEGAIRIVDAEERMRRRQEECYQLIDAACVVLYGEDGVGGLEKLVPPWWCDCIWWHYLGCETWERVGEILGFTARRCWEVSQSAMDVADANGMASTVAGAGMAEA